MPKAIRLSATGGPEVLKWEDVEVGDPGEGEARVRHTAGGVNFIDTYQRSGLYPIPIPGGIGGEAAGVVEAVGPGVTTVQPGDRVAYGGSPPGAYSQSRLIPAAVLVPIPDGVADETAAAVMLKGMTAQYLIRRTYPVQAGETVLFHADGRQNGNELLQGGDRQGPRLRSRHRLDPGGHRWARPGDHRRGGRPGRL